MKKTFTWILCLCLAGLCWTGCGGNENESNADEETTESAEKTGDDLEAGAAELAKAVGRMGAATGGNDNVDVEPVEFRVLKDLLPGSAAGLDRSNASGEKSSAFGVKVSNAEGSYESGEASMKITLTDMGTMKGLAAFGFAWLMTEMDREDDNGFERTTKFEGYPAYEEYQKADGHGKMQIIVAERFSVDIEGNGVTIDQIRNAAEQIDLGKLASMKDEGVTKK